MKHVLSIIAALILAIGAPLAALAADANGECRADGFIECAALDDDSARLRCFDEAVLSLGGAATEVASSVPSDATSPSVRVRQAKAKDLGTSGDEIDVPTPMLLEVPIPWISTMQDDERKSVPGIRRYWCDDVRIGLISFTKEERKRGKAPTWDISMSLYVRPSHDREVDIKVEVFRGEEVGLRLFQRELEVEEGRSKLVNWRSMEANFAPGGTPWSIRIVLDVRED